MPQLMPLLWEFSIIMCFFLMMIMVFLYNFVIVKNVIIYNNYNYNLLDWEW